MQQKVLLHLISLAEKDEDKATKLDNSKDSVTGESTFTPLCVEILYSEFEGSMFEGWINVSLAHYGESNGDAMREPEMCFLVKEEKCIPYYYRFDWVGIEQVLLPIYTCPQFFEIPFKDRVIQRSQAEFSNVWMRNINYQQELGFELSEIE